MSPSANCVVCVQCVCVWHTLLCVYVCVCVRVSVYCCFVVCIYCAKHTCRELYVYVLVGRSYATDMYERWLLGISPAIAVPSGHARANASAHVTFIRTTSERKLCFSAKLRRQRCCLAERCLQGILPACRPIHCPRPGARASKKRTRERARTSSGFSLRNRSSPQFLCLQLVPPSLSVHVSNAGPRSRDSAR